TAQRFQEEGAKLVLAGLSAPTNPLPLAAVPCFTCDASVPLQVETLFQQAIAHLGGLDVLYHVAGGSGRRFGDGPLHECTDEGWRRPATAPTASASMSSPPASLTRRWPAEPSATRPFSNSYAKSSRWRAVRAGHRTVAMRPFSFAATNPASLPGSSCRWTAAGS